MVFQSIFPLVFQHSVFGKSVVMGLYINGLFSLVIMMVDFSLQVKWESLVIYSQLDSPNQPVKKNLS